MKEGHFENEHYLKKEYKSSMVCCRLVLHAFTDVVVSFCPRRDWTSPTEKLSHMSSLAGDDIQQVSTVVYAHTHAHIIYTYTIHTYIHAHMRLQLKDILKI